MTDKPKESKGQEEMKETGAKLDDSQQNQLDEFMTDLKVHPPEKDGEEEEAPKVYPSSSSPSSSDC